jgi:hypothetical protein
MEHREEIYFQGGILGNVEELNQLPESGSTLILITESKKEKYILRRDGGLFIIELAPDQFKPEVKKSKPKTKQPVEPPATEPQEPVGEPQISEQVKPKPRTSRKATAKPKQKKAEGQT